MACFAIFLFFVFFALGTLCPLFSIIPALIGIIVPIIHLKYGTFYNYDKDEHYMCIGLSVLMLLLFCCHLKDAFG